MSSSLLKRPIANTPFALLSQPPPNATSAHRSSPILGRTSLFILLSLVVILGVFLPWSEMAGSVWSGTSPEITKWRRYTLSEAAAFVAKNRTLIVCAVSEAYLPFLNNWLISIVRQGHHEKVLVIAEDYATLYKVNERWPGHAVLIPPALDSQTAHKFGSQVHLTQQTDPLMVALLLSTCLPIAMSSRMWSKITRLV